MKRVLAAIPNYSETCPDAINLFESHGIEVVENKLDRCFSLSELIEIVPDIDGVIAGIEPWIEEAFRAATKLKVISRFGVGYETVDLIKAKEYGVKVTNVRSIELSNSVADLTIALILSVERNIPALNTSIRKGAWTGPLGHTLRDRSVGLIGFGAIAQLVAKRLSGFEANIFAYDMYPNYDKAKELNVRMVSFEEIIKNCDIISIHVPTSKETNHLIGKAQFNMMKDEAIIVNTARGAIVDEKALYEALKTKKIRGAATDVFEQEPADLGNPLFELENFICTPHIAWRTFENIKSTSLISAQAVIDVLEGRIPENLLNP